MKSELLVIELGHNVTFLARVCTCWDFNIARKFKSNGFKINEKLLMVSHCSTVNLPQFTLL